MRYTIAALGLAISAIAWMGAVKQPNPLPGDATVIRPIEEPHTARAAGAQECTIWRC